MRPRYGLLRGREFIMKDLYTFDINEEYALKTYEEVLIAYKNIFDKIRIPFVIVSFLFNKGIFIEILVVYAFELCRQMQIQEILEGLNHTNFTFYL
jgi:tRNA synthetase class II core domain (G, H, P, S and T)